MSCANPTDAAVLADYWLGKLAGPDEEAVEEHLFGCDACGARLREVIALAEGVRELAHEGNLLMVVSDAYLKRAAREGLRIREYAPPRGGSIECTVSVEDDLLIGRLNANFSGLKQVDLCLCDKSGAEQMRLADIPFPALAGSVAFQQPIGYAKAAPSETMIARLMGVDDAGAEMVVGEYTFNHTRTIAGPPGW